MSSSSVNPDKISIFVPTSELLHGDIMQLWVPLKHISFWNTLHVPFETFRAIVTFQLYEHSKGTEKIGWVAVLYIPLGFCLQSVT